MKKVCAYCKHDEFTKDDNGGWVCDACGCGMLKELEEVEEKRVLVEHVLDELKLCAQAIAFYGHDAQMLKTVEELAELGAEIMHYRDGKVSADVVVSELADVMIMSEQMRLVFGETVVDTKVVEKLERLEKRMGQGEGLRKEKELKQKIDEFLAIFVKELKDTERLFLIGKVGRLCAEYEAQSVNTMLAEKRARLEVKSDSSCLVCGHCGSKNIDQSPFENNVGICLDCFTEVKHERV